MAGVTPLVLPTNLVAPHAPRVCLRGDTDFNLTEHFDRCARRVDFVFGMDASPVLRQRAEALDAARWRRLHRPAPYQNSAATLAPGDPTTSSASYASAAASTWNSNFEDVAEFYYRPGKCSRAYRVIALRKNISEARGEQVLFDEVRYFFYITTYMDLPMQQVVALANQRCDQENVIEQLKNGVNALRVPLYDLVSNWRTWSSPRSRGTSSPGSP
jgi:hypothetical protein